MKNWKGKVFVGLSGGVDSAVSAALLQKEGYEVTGVFIKAWTPEGYPCTWKEDRRSAMKAAAVLDIPFITLDLEKEYKKEVVDYMIAEYKIGRTPNPDVMCNKEIKFGHFLRFALKNGADFVATGHYCQTSPLAPLLEKERGEEKTQITNPHEVVAPPLEIRGGRGRYKYRQGGEVCFLEGIDKNKDQSYFLWTLGQEQLKHILFPIGALQKDAVRKLAKKFGLPQAIRKDSQGICFLGQVNMKEFLGRYVPPRKGNVLNESGKVVGYHSGAIFFTMGERHGFTITEKTDNEVPLYVIDKDISKNTITVAPVARKKIAVIQIAKKKLLLKKSSGLLANARPDFPISNFLFGNNPVILKDINWISGRAPDLAKKYLARIRYRQEKVGCKIEIKGKEVKVIFDEPQMGVSPGQSLVLYSGDICLGGGIIS